MDDKLYKILRKIYFKEYASSSYKLDEEHDLAMLFSTNNLDDAEKAYLAESKWEVNKVEHYTHDDILKRFEAVLKHPNMTEPRIIRAFIAGMDSFPRGRQTIMSYLYARRLEQHAYEGTPSVCSHCCIKQSKWENTSFEIAFFLYNGMAWNEHKTAMLIDLEEFVTLPDVNPTATDYKMFEALISLIADAPDGETVSKLEKRIKQAKVLSEKDKYKLRGILMALADMGIMPNRYMQPIYDSFTRFDEQCKIATSQPARSDIELPLCGWRGELGINRKRLEEIMSLERLK